jgi:hypothetical protein
MTEQVVKPRNIYGPTTDTPASYLREPADAHPPLKPEVTAAPAKPKWPPRPRNRSGRRAAKLKWPPAAEDRYRPARRGRTI